ncbi:MAG: hypothetical protein HC809_01690 [Gammaproteobacteria bacterium]|nr:hypothetical protein [Gammaproteobacteria bacterium]
MLKLAFCSALILLAGCASTATQSTLEFEMGRFTDGVPEIPADLLATTQRYGAARGAINFGWLDDGLLISTRFGESNQLHRVRTAMGMREQLTFFDGPVAGAWVPAIADPRGFVFARDEGGAEFSSSIPTIWERDNRDD